MPAGKINLESMDMDALLELRDQVEDRIQDLAQDELQALENKMARLRPLAGKKKAGVRGKAPIKYRDPKTGNAWSGRGMTPVWLREHEASGKSREDFAV